MPTLVQGQVGAPSTPVTDGSPQSPRLGRYQDAIVSEYRGKYAEANTRGQVFHACTPVAGVTIPIFSNTAQTYGLLNPPQSNVIAELIRLEVGYLSGADVPGNLVFCVPPVQGGVIATGSGGITAATQTSPQSGQYRSGSSPPAKCQMLTSITTVAPTFVRTLGFSAETAVAASTNAAFWQVVQFDGTDLLYPGAALFLGASVAAAIGVCVINLVFMEHSYPAGT